MQSCWSVGANEYWVGEVEVGGGAGTMGKKCKLSTSPAGRIFARWAQLHVPRPQGLGSEDSHSQHLTT